MSVPLLSSATRNNTCTFITFLYIVQAVAVYGITQLTEGLERKKLVGDFSYALPFFQSEDDFFRDNPYRLQVIVLQVLGLHVIELQVIELQALGLQVVGNKYFLTLLLCNVYILLIIKINKFFLILNFFVLRKNYFGNCRLSFQIK